MYCLFRVYFPMSYTLCEFRQSVLPWTVLNRCPRHYFGKSPPDKNDSRLLPDLSEKFRYRYLVQKELLHFHFAVKTTDFPNFLCRTEYNVIKALQVNNPCEKSWFVRLFYFPLSSVLKSIFLAQLIIGKILFEKCKSLK